MTPTASGEEKCVKLIRIGIDRVPHDIPLADLKIHGGVGTL